MASRLQRYGCALPTRWTSAALVALLLIASRAATAADHPLEASALVLKDSGVRQRMRLTTLPSALALPTESPASTGATIEIRNSATGELATLPIPSGDGWTSDASKTSYVGRSIDGTPAPVRVLRMKAGSRLKLATRSTVLTLDEATQGSLTVTVSVGSDRYCVTCDVPAKDQAGTFVAHKCTAPASCPAVQTATTTTTQSTTTTIADDAFAWSRQMGGSVLADSVVPSGVAVDGSGNAIVTGAVYGSVKFDTIAVTSAGRGDLFIAKYSPGGAVQWVQAFGDDADQFGTAVATDTAGNIYVTGYFFGTASFGGAALTSNAWDIVLAKYTPNGAHVWSKRIGGANYDMGQTLAVDGAGNVIVGGQFAGTANFGGMDLTSAGGYDGFLAKYDTDGVHQWSKRLGGASLDTVTGMGVDAGGNVTAVGYFAGTANFGGANLTSAGNNDVFVVRYSAAGAHQWSNRYGDADDQRAYAAAVDAGGNVALTGYYYGTIGFGGVALPNTGGGADIFLAKLDASGSHVWSKGFGTPDTYGEVGKGVAIDGAGNVLLTGEIIRNVDFGGGALIPPTITYDPFVAKFSSGGLHQWSRRFSAPWDDHGNGIAVDAGGNVLLTGDFTDEEDFGGGPMSSPGGSDGFLAKFAP